MRLIDSDRLKTYLSEYLHYDHAISWVDAQPTAYDIDKVVEELEQHYDDDSVICGLVYNDAIKRAIEIVKHGCVSDDVCEWKFTKGIMDNDEFKVGCNPNALKRGIVPNNFSYHDFKFCPYCGKKIKVVE